MVKSFKTFSQLVDFEKKHPRAHHGKTGGRFVKKAVVPPPAPIQTFSHWLNASSLGITGQHFSTLLGRSTFSDKPDPVLLKGDKVAFYHGTTKDVVADIKKYGLKPHASQGADAWASVHRGKGTEKFFMAGDRKLSVYFANNPKNAISFAKLAAVHRGGEPIILEIDLPIEEAKKVQLDDRGDTGMFRYVGEIKPEYIAREINFKGVEATLENVQEDTPPRTVKIYAIIFSL